MDGLDASNRFGWEDSAQAWIDTVERDAHRTHLLDPIVLELSLAGSTRAALDVGCGEGRFVRMLSECGVDAVGIDPIPRLVEAGRQSRADSKLIVASGEELPFRSGSFDAVVFYLTLIDIPDYRRAVCEAHRVLRPGGAVVVANVHPIVTSHLGWVLDDQGNRLHWPVDNYMEERPQIAEWNGIRVANFHRPLTSYTDAFLSKGFALDHLSEPLPERGAAEQRPGLKDHFRVPNFIVMRWTKKS